MDAGKKRKKRGIRASAELFRNIGSEFCQMDVQIDRVGSTLGFNELNFS